MSHDNTPDGGLSLTQMRAIMKSHRTSLGDALTSFPDERMLQRIFDNAISQLPCEVYADCKQLYQAQLGEMKRLRHECTAALSEALALPLLRSPQAFWEKVDRYATLRASLLECLCGFNQLFDDADVKYDELSMRRREKRLDALSQKVSMMHGLLAKQAPTQSSTRSQFCELNRRVHQLSASLLKHQKAIDEERRLQHPHRGVAQLDSCDTIERLEQQAALTYTELCDCVGLNRHIST